MIYSHRRRARRSGLPRRLFVALLALGAFGAAVLAWLQLAPGKPRLNADQAVARSAAALKAHNASDARDLAMAAVRDRPNDAAAHLALAKAMLALDDGVGADAELQRMVDSGGKPMPHLRAEAFLLQGDAAKASAEAGRAAQQYRSYSLRVRGRALRAQGDWAGASTAMSEALRLAPRDADAWSDAGALRLASGDLLGANAAVQRALSLDAGHLAALTLRGVLIRDQYGLLAALPWFEAALKRDPRDHDALIEYAATLGDAGRAVDALAATRRALAARSASPQALYLQAVIAARAGHLELAATLLGRAGAAINTLPGAQLLKGALDLQAGDHEQAITRLKALTDAQPMNLIASRLLASAMLRRDSAAAAMAVLRPFAARGDADSYTLLLAARGLERLGDRNAAAALIDRSTHPVAARDMAFTVDDTINTLAAAADQRPGDPDAAVLLLRGLFDQGGEASGLKRAQQIAMRYPGVPAAQLLLGDALMLARRPGEAVALYQRAADMRFDSPTMLRLVEALEASGKPEDAARALALFLSQNPMNEAALRLSARAQLAGNDFEAAINTLEQVRHQIGDGDAVLNAELALAYAGAGATSTAQDLAEAAYALAPGNPRVTEAFGWALYQGGDLPHAAEVMRKALRLAPGNVALRSQLAQIQADFRKR